MRVWLSVLAVASAQMGSFFDQMFQQQQRQQHEEVQKLGANPVERIFHEFKCHEYLCADSLSCVLEPLDCPCPFPDSQLKCVYPDNSAFVCISKPTDGGPGCQFVEDAFYGRV